MTPPKAPKPQDDPKPEAPIYESWSWGDTFCLIFILFVFSFAGYGLFSCANDLKPWYHELFAKKEQPAPERSPGELVDAAMEIPGAIVISPHEDLIKKGILTIESGYEGTKEYFCSPAIAVHTKKNWCVWELGNECKFRTDMGGFTYKTNVDGHGIGGSTSNGGYEYALNSLKRCVEEGNAPPRIQIPDICEGLVWNGETTVCSKFHHPTAGDGK